MESDIVFIIFMILLSIFINYYLNSMLPPKKHTTDNLHKFYMAIFTGLETGLLGIIGKIFITGNFVSTLIPLFILLFLLNLFIGYKLYALDFITNEEQFMLAMIEHHSLALSMANKIKGKTNTKQLTNIVDNIISSQTQQIDQMYSLLQKND